jgi:hypothetical protein
MKSSVETRQQQLVDKQLQKLKTQATKAWDKFCKIATTEKFLKQAVSDSTYGGCFQFKTGLKGFDSFIPLRDLFKTKDWIVDNYKIINEQLILVIKIPTFNEPTLSG